MTEPEQEQIPEPDALIPETVINCPRCGGRHPLYGEHSEGIPLPMGPRTMRNLGNLGRVIS